MPMSFSEAAEVAMAQLSDSERRQAVLYLDEDFLAAGESLEIDGRMVPINQPTAVAFVDREPGVNWGHDCRYVLVDLEGERVESVPAQLPPFLRGVPKGLRVIWKGDAVADWAVAKPE